MNRALAAMLAAAATAAVLSGATGSASTTEAAGQRYTSERYGFSLRLPAGWRRAADRLVPLIMPREILSVGTTRMPAGGGPPSQRESAASLSLRRGLHGRGERVPADEELWSTTLPFISHGRWFDALVYVRGEPAPARMRQIRSILDRLRLRAGIWVG